MATTKKNSIQQNNIYIKEKQLKDKKDNIVMMNPFYDDDLWNKAMEKNKDEDPADFFDNVIPKHYRNNTPEYKTAQGNTRKQSVSDLTINYITGKSKMSKTLFSHTYDVGDMIIYTKKVTHKYAEYHNKEDYSYGGIVRSITNNKITIEPYDIVFVKEYKNTDYLSWGQSKRKKNINVSPLNLQKVNNTSFYNCGWRPNEYTEGGLYYEGK